MGLGAWKMLAIRDSKTKQELLSSANNQPQITTCSDLIVFLQRKQLDSLYLSNISNIKYNANQIKKEQRAEFEDRIKSYLKTKNEAEIDTWLGKQVYIALGWMLSIAALENVDSCPMEGFSNTEFDKKLNLTNTDYKSTVLCALGYRDLDHPSKNWKRARLDKKDLVKII